MQACALCRLFIAKYFIFCFQNSIAVEVTWFNDIWIRVTLVALVLPSDIICFLYFIKRRRHFYFCLEPSPLPEALGRCRSFQPRKMAFGWTKSKRDKPKFQVPSLSLYWNALIVYCYLLVRCFFNLVTHLSVVLVGLTETFECAYRLIFWLFSDFF